MLTSARSSSSNGDSCPLCCARVVDHDGELVAAEAHHEIVRAHGRPEPGCDLDQDQVPRMVTPPVVDGLEAVQVEVDDPAPAMRMGDLVEPGEQDTPVGEPGERIVARPVLEFGLFGFQRGVRGADRAEVQHDRRVRGQRVEELDVGLRVVEHATGLTDGDQAGQAALGAQLGDDERPHSERAEGRAVVRAERSAGSRSDAEKLADH